MLSPYEGKKLKEKMSSQIATITLKGENCETENESTPGKNLLIELSERTK